ncbi:MAG: ATP-binding protein [Kiritimatiellae bacterium]|nr:ATP-binding protein [Kiritimatiellia bacterium]
MPPSKSAKTDSPPALRRLAEETCTLYNIACSFKEGGAPQNLASDEMVHLYHIAQEAINNATRHGHATEIEIALTPEQLTITDNGRGFDPSQITPGAGLRIMRHRATRLGAKFAPSSNPGKTQIKITLPSANYPRIVIGWA